MGGFGLGPAASGYLEATQWLHQPQGHRTSLDDDLDGASGDGDDKTPGRLRRLVDRALRAARRVTGRR